MQNRIAILFEKKSIGKFSFAFIAINCIEGELTKDNKFITKEEAVYYNINDTQSLFTSEQYFFGYPTTIDNLKKQFRTRTKKEALIEYISFFDDNLILGNLDNNNELSIINVNLDDYFYNKGKIEFINSKVDYELESIKNEIDSRNYKKAVDMLEKRINVSTDKSNTCNNTNVRKKINVKELIDSVNKNVIAQEEAVDTIATTIAINHMTDNARNHANILVTGPTGVGKTEILNSIAREISVPCVVADMNSITQEGYVGKSIDSLIAKIYNAANGNLEIAQRGILVLDEIDKKASQRNDDVAGRAVLNSLLKMLDGNIMDVNIGTSQKPIYINFDTSHLTIVSVGAFAGLDNNKKNPIGFGSTTVKQDLKKSYFEYGMPEEFMGRMGVIANLHGLKFEDYINILLKSCNSPLVLKGQLLCEYGVLLHPTEDYICEIARKTVELRAGARGLKIAINESLQPALTEIIKNNVYNELLVTGETVDNPKKYILK